MKQTVLARKELNECTVRHDGTYFSFVDFTYFRYGYDTFDDTHCVFNALLVGSGNFNSADVVYFFNSDCCTGLFLHTLDDLSARADYGADEFFRNSHGFDAGSMRLQVIMRLCNTFGDFAQDVFAAFFSLQQCFLQNLVRQTVYLDVHLGSSDTVFCTGYFEVHIAEVVFIAEDVRQYGIFFFTSVLNQSHCDT